MIVCTAKKIMVSSFLSTFSSANNITVWARALSFQIQIKKKRLEEKFAIVKDPRSASPSTSYKTRNWPKEGIVSSEDLLAAVGGK